MTVATTRRMDPERRREQLLGVAAGYIGMHGIDVSLDDIAREAGISPPLMRHYFRNRDGLIAELTERAVQELEDIYLNDNGGDLGDRLTRYLDWIQTHRWAHCLWVTSAAGSSSEPDFRPTRRRMIERTTAGPRSLDDDDALLIRGNAWIAVIESTVTRWLEDGTPDRDELVSSLLDLAVRLDVAGAQDAQAARVTRQRSAA